MQKKKRYIIKRMRKSKYFALYTYVLLVLLVLTSVASYAWFEISRNPSVKDMQMYITSAYGLELSVDPTVGGWGQQIDFWDTQELSKFKEKKYGFQKPILQQITWSEANDQFFAPVYGYDGRLVSFFNNYADAERRVIGWQPLEDKSHANKATWLEGHYIKTTVYARSGQITDVTLAPEAFMKGIPARTYVKGNPNTGRGPESAVRFGFRMTWMELDDGNLVEVPDTRSSMYVYEPNCDVHADGTINQYIRTDSIDNEVIGQGGTIPEGETAIPLVPEERLIKQKFPDLTDPDTPGVFETNPVLCTIKPGEIVRIEIYFWLEGQDVDCSNIMEVREVDIADDDIDLEIMEEDRKHRENVGLETEEQPFHLEALIQFVGPARTDDGLESWVDTP